MSGIKVGWLYDERMLWHETGPSHPERPERLLAIREGLENAGLLQQMIALPIEPATPADVALVHDPAYIDLVRLACEDGFPFLGERDTHIGPNSYACALLAAGAAMTACNAVLDGRIHRAFCAVRPPGHHAEYDHAMGFCLFNNAGIAAQHLLDRRGLERVAIIDFDVHHGNSTQHLFEDCARVLYIGLHEDPATLPWPGTGTEDEVGNGHGHGYTLNIPLPAGSGAEAYHRAFDERILPRLAEYRPQFLLVSAGFDPLASDPISHINLAPADFRWITRRLADAADTLCDGRLVSVLEGGYDLERLGECAAEHVKGMMKDER